MSHSQNTSNHVTNIPFSVKYTSVEAQSVLKEREREEEKEREYQCRQPYLDKFSDGLETHTLFHDRRKGKL